MGSSEICRCEIWVAESGPIAAALRRQFAVLFMVQVIYPDEERDQSASGWTDRALTLIAEDIFEAEIGVAFAVIRRVIGESCHRSRFLVDRAVPNVCAREGGESAIEQLQKQRARLTLEGDRLVVHHSLGCGILPCVARVDRSELKDEKISLDACELTASAAHLKTLRRRSDPA